MMWVMKDKDGDKSWTDHEDIAETLRVHHGYEVTPVVPASEVREKDELIGRLADRLAAEVRESFYFTNDSHELEETDKRSSAAVVKVMESFGLRKVGGTWERCK